MNKLDRDSWIEVGGIINRGHQVASGQATDSPYPAGSIALQLPHFLDRGLDLRNCYAGTLNISIAPRTFTMQQPEYRFRQVAWSPLIAPEDFSFSACEVVFSGQAHRGYVYYPHPETKPDHFQDESTVEVICPLIQGIGYGSAVLLRMNPQEINLLP